jgi:hypothetical protein
MGTSRALLAAVRMILVGNSRSWQFVFGMRGDKFRHAGQKSTGAA